jgi:hypothetical protein
MDVAKEEFGYSAFSNLRADFLKALYTVVSIFTQKSQIVYHFIPVISQFL